MRKSPSSLPVAASLALLVVVFFVVVFAPAGVPAAQGKAVGPPEVAWKDMTFPPKKAYMKEAVVPTM